jgi:two-component system response regulator (stage 0 sporulation protein F)
MQKNIRILLVDDEADFRQLMTFWLKSKGYSVTTAIDGKNALEMIKKEMPDIIFLDLRMPVMNGVEVLKRIRRFNKDVPVIIISAYLNDPEAKDLTSYGISGVFYKGENFEEALPLLETALRVHRKLKKE